MRQGFWSSTCGRGVLSLMCLVVGSTGAAWAGTSGPLQINGNTTITNSTTHETTVNTLPTIQAYQTTVLGVASESGSDCVDPSELYQGTVTVFDQTVSSSPSSSEVASLFNQAINTVTTSVSTSTSYYDGQLHYLSNGTVVFPGRTASYSVDGPCLVSSSSSSSTSNTTLGTNTTTAVTTTIGPGTVLFGDDQGQSFMVAAGNININTNTDYHTFINSQTTVTNQATYEVTGSKYVSPIVLDLGDSGSIQASDGVYLPHPQQFHTSHKVLFDFYGNGFPVAMEWVGPKDGLLCKPKADGSVDGTCLFGTSTGYENGFEQLASLDLNMDYHLRGAELEGLMVWQDKNGNAKVDAGELKSLKELGINDISLKPSKMKSSFVMNGKTHAMFDWWPTVLQLKRLPKAVKPSV